MVRKSIILFTILAVIAGTVGMPVNVHSCAMKGDEVVAPTCNMCGPAHKKVAAPESRSKSKPCCNDRVEIVHTDKASAAQPGFALTGPLLLAVPVYSQSAPIALISRRSDFPSRSHSPPPDLLKDRTYLFNSSFLI